MKKRLQGTDIPVQFSIFSGSSGYDLAGKTLSAYIIRDRQAHRIIGGSVDGNKFIFTFSGTDQVKFGPGVYSFRLWENEGQKPGQKLLADEAFLLLVPMGSTVQTESGQIMENVTIIEGGQSSGTSFNIHSLTGENTLADGDELAIYDVSASAHRKTTWGNIVSKIGTALSSVFAAITHTHTKSQITDLDMTAYRTSSAQDAIDAGKVDKVTGKGLSTNDYDNAEKANVAANTTARHTHSNKGVLDGITQTLINAWNGAVSALSGKQDATNSLTTEDAIDNADELPFYDTSASGSRKTTWQNIISKIGTALSSVFAAISHTHTKSQITDFPTIPSSLSDLSDDSTHRTVTDTEKSNWNGKGTYSKPANGIPASDLASGVIPSVPTIATTLNAQSVNTQTAGAKAVYDAINPTMTVNTTDASVSVALNCDKTYKYMLSSGVTSLTVTGLNAAPNDGAEHLYRLKFRSGATATQFTPPAGTIYLDGEVPSIKTNTVYEVTWDTDMCMTVVAFAAVSE